MKVDISTERLSKAEILQKCSERMITYINESIERDDWDEKSKKKVKTIKKLNRGQWVQIALLAMEEYLD